MKNIKSSTKKFKLVSSISIDKAVPVSEKILRNQVSIKRKVEMDKYGRIDIYNKISKFLQGNRREAFSLVNHSLAIVDDEIDDNGNKNQLNKAKAILRNGFQRKKIKTTKMWERNVFKLGLILFCLDRDGFKQAKKIFNEVITYWKIEKKNLDRKGKILNLRSLDKLNLNIGKSVILQFLYLLCPNLNDNSKKSIASLYGFSIKLADNIADLHEDIKEGYINISKEDIERYNLNIFALKKDGLSLYKRKEFERIKKYYKESDKTLVNVSKKYSSQKKGLLFIKDFSRSWLKQVKEMCF